MSAGDASRERIRDVTLNANGLRFHALSCGPADGPLVLLLHGFPELSISWKSQLTALADAGFWAVAPDQRGYGQTERRGPYDIGTLADDVAELIRALGRDDAFIVGHDWGGAVAWAMAMRHPREVRGLVAANCPPASVLARRLLSSPSQWAKSSYMFFFQIPKLPERVLTKNHSSAIARSLVGGSYVRTAFSSRDLDEYRDAFSQPGAATAALNWYRAAIRHPLRGRADPARKVKAPTLVLWGTRDRFLGEELIDPERLASVMSVGNRPEIVKFPESGHFIQNEVPDQFNHALIEWLSRQ